MSDTINLYNAGTQALMDGELTSAVDLLTRAVSKKGPPGIMGPAWRNLGLALRKTGETNRAMMAFQEAIEINANDTESWYSLGNTRLALGNHDAAITAFQTVRRIKPNCDKAANNEGASWMALGRTFEAEQCFSDAVRLNPNASQAWGNLGAARAALGRHAAPLRTLQKALSINPNDISIRCRLGHLLTELGHFDAAIRTFEVVLKTHHSRSDARAGISLALHRKGDTVGALARIAPAIASGEPHPDESVAYARICLHMGQPECAIPSLKNSLSKAVQPATQVLLGKHLGQLLDAAGHTEAAFHAIDQANRIRNLDFSAANHRLQIDTIIERFDHASTKSDCQDEVPVFIVGVPRSGTSLIEQMLDGHPEIHGAGERAELQMIASHMFGKSLQTSDLDALAQSYLSRVRPLAPEARRIIDKMPDNFLFLGEAARLFPNARVIHCTRDPADTGLSVLFQHFKDTLPWASRQEDIAAYVDDYRRLMDYWAAHCPLRMLTVPYESVVQNPEEWGRRITRFLGLSFHPAVIEPENNPRVVRTASFDQVRRPIHTNSIGRSHAYETHIPQLLALKTQTPQSDVDHAVETRGHIHAR